MNRHLWGINILPHIPPVYGEKGLLSIKPGALPDEALEVRQLQLLGEVTPPRLVMPLGRGQLSDNPWVNRVSREE